MKNYIWDFDGMLFDSYPHIAEAFRLMMEKHGRQVDAAEARALLEDRFAVCYAHYSVTPEMAKEHNALEHDYDLKPVVVPFENTEKTLTILKARGARHFLYTHRGFETSQYYLKKYGFLPLFDGFVDSSCGFPEKPAPDAINRICSRYGLDKSETIMTGDREIDVAAGRNAGVHTCLYTKKAAAETVAEHIISDIIQIIEIQ